MDAGVTLKGKDDRWEVALIGKNLTDKLVASNCSLADVAGGIILPFNGDNYGYATPGAAGTPEKLCFADGPGRSVWIRLTLKPFR